MPNYRKKPIVIEARQLTEESLSNILEWVASDVEWWDWSDGDNEIIIKTLEGNIKAVEFDFIIKGVKGEFYPCKPDIFKMTYEEVNA